MLHTFVVGLGRSGEGLHLPSLAKARAREPTLFAPGPVVGFDPFRASAEGVLMVESPEEAVHHAPPLSTVVHLCTPPHLRSGLLEHLAELGYRRIIVEKPLALDLVGLASVARLRRRWGLDITVTTQWLDSALTRRLLAVLRGKAFGDLRAITVLQNKPRFTRTAEAPGHPTAFDVEVPHALAVVITLAGGADIASASLEDMVTDRTRLPRLGRARLGLRHHSGVLSRIDSDLTSPVRERRIVLEFDRALLTGHYPCSAADHTAQLRVDAQGWEPIRSVFDDDAFPAFIRAAYTRYARSHRAPGALSAQIEAVRLLTEAKNLCASGTRGQGVGSVVGA
ncbi:MULTISPECIES: Gfo/Idh/MocA family oxidoreductase [Nocardiopsis]|uniref:Oxidoreductase n=1 Tax=Nocardiopsis sinuspersici TaxID=501010 RepID=A0A1V3BYI8_9ACTN|nr:MULTISPECIES: oxidoreductase [Nocardiopsis]OOC53432.1 oxidoreductase [Nocardiopsis sinuspersici]